MGENMREITKQMIDDFKLKKLGYDFMGYEFNRANQLSFHHLIIPRRNCKAFQIPSEGYVYWNGAILRQDTAHEYLHLIQSKDYDRFCYISSELIDINIQRAILYEQLKNIHDCLCGFEREYSGVRSKKGNELIKEEYTRRLIKR